MSWSTCSIRRRVPSIVWSSSGAMPRCSGPADRPVEVSMRSLLRRSLLILTLAVVPTLATAQQYFGQNRVQYRTFDFQVIQTEHFDVYSSAEARAAAFDDATLV